MMKNIQIKGIVTVKADLSASELMDKFIQWIEDNGFEFNGGTSEISTFDFYESRHFESDPEHKYDIVDIEG